MRKGTGRRGGRRTVVNIIDKSLDSSHPPGLQDLEQTVPNIKLF